VSVGRFGADAYVSRTALKTALEGWLQNNG
jgi:hypothetical protein